MRNETPENKAPFISLCLPTNGVLEWVRPVLESIYQQDVNSDEFEVIVTDNGDNEEFRKWILEFALLHDNLIYQKTDSYLFDNQIECLRIAKGEFLKFVNHRTKFNTGSLRKMIDFVFAHRVDKPVIYFSNGSLSQKPVICEFSDFDRFVCGLKHFASWTTGVGVWREDFLNIPSNAKYDKISPHSLVLFCERKKQLYIIHDEKLMEEVDPDDMKKGRYDLFRAFAVEEISITLKLFIDGDISADTFKKVKKAYEKFVVELYYMYCIRMRPCSYDLTGFDDAMGIFMKKSVVLLNAYLYPIKRKIQKILNV